MHLEVFLSALYTSPHYFQLLHSTQSTFEYHHTLHHIKLTALHLLRIRFKLAHPSLGSGPADLANPEHIKLLPTLSAGLADNQSLVL